MNAALVREDKMLSYELVLVYAKSLSCPDNSPYLGILEQLVFFS